MITSNCEMSKDIALDLITISICIRYLKKHPDTIKSEVEMLSYTELKGINNAKTLEQVKTKGFLNQKFVIQEKIHGSNVSFRFTDANSPMAVHSRNQQITEHDKFFGIQAELHKYKVVEDKIREYMRKNENIKSFYIFGEYFGGAIQSGIDYGHEKRILFFDIYVNEELVDYVTFEKLQKEIGIENFCVKPLAIVENFDEALNFDIGFNTNYSNKTKDNLCEGIVIKQYQRRDVVDTATATATATAAAASNTDDDSEFETGSLLLCKRKNTGFLESAVKESKPKEKKDASTKPTPITNYINENRIESYISKIAQVDTFNEQQINDIINDALKDYLIDYPNFVLDDKTKTICRAKIQGLHKKLKVNT